MARNRNRRYGDIKQNREKRQRSYGNHLPLELLSSNGKTARNRQKRARRRLQKYNLSRHAEPYFATSNPCAWRRLRDSKDEKTSVPVNAFTLSNKNEMPTELDVQSAEVQESRTGYYKVRSISTSAGFTYRNDFPNVFTTTQIFSTPPGGLRMIVIDGMNVGYGYGNNKTFYYEGIIHCINYFRDRGHRVKVFMPRHRINEIPAMVVEKLRDDRILVITPSRNPGNERRINAYDDRFIVQYATMTGGIIISNDNYNDLFKEEPSWRDTIRKRILQHTWIDNQTLMFPLDPMGRNNKMRLDEYLRYSEGTSENFSV